MTRKFAERLAKAINFEHSCGKIITVEKAKALKPIPNNDGIDVYAYQFCNLTILVHYCGWNDTFDVKFVKW